MGMREKIARWLTPEWENERRNQLDRIRDLGERGREAVWEAGAMRFALYSIIARANTASPNSTVKAIVKIAQDALEAK